VLLKQQSLLKKDLVPLPEPFSLSLTVVAVVVTGHRCKRSIQVPFFVACTTSDAVQDKQVPPPKLVRERIYPPARLLLRCTFAVE
jgi:hypothetical protein